eukprot:12077313-Alexandrium_andersonii.AAC.1
MKDDDDDSGYNPTRAPDSTLADGSGSKTPTCDEQEAANETNNAEGNTEETDDALPVDWKLLAERDAAGLA